MNNFSTLIARRTLHLMKERNWKACHLATRSGISPSTMGNVLKAHSKSITTETLLNICRGLDISLKDFFNDEMFKFENIADD